MNTTIGLVANVYNEINALPGWLETHLPFFDDVRVLHAGPCSTYSDDGTIELLEKWHVPVAFTAIDEGFGAVRTKAVRLSPCDYVMILDADERFYPVHRILRCSGESTPHEEVDAILYNYDFRNGKTPDWTAIGRLGSNLSVSVSVPYDQGARLREMLSDESNRPDAVATVRRHWHDFSFKRPTQDWTCNMDWQLRLVRNDPSIEFATEQRMHERLRGHSPERVVYADRVHGPFFDHFHFIFKRMEQEQRGHDVAIYDALHEGKQPPTREEHTK